MPFRIFRKRSTGFVVNDRTTTRHERREAISEAETSHQSHALELETTGNIPLLIIIRILDQQRECFHDEVDEERNYFPGWWKQVPWYSRYHRTESIIHKTEPLQRGRPWLWITGGWVCEAIKRASGVLRITWVSPIVGDEIVPSSSRRLCRLNRIAVIMLSWIPNLRGSKTEPLNLVLSHTSSDSHLEFGSLPTDSYKRFPLERQPGGAFTCGSCYRPRCFILGKPESFLVSFGLRHSGNGRRSTLGLDPRQVHHKHMVEVH